MCQDVGMISERISDEREKMNGVRWVTLGSAAMHEAQSRLGFSHERIARELDISSKTWERWLRRGAVPARSVSAVATLLRITVEDPEPVRADPHEDLRRIVREELDSRLETIDVLLGEIARRLANGELPQDGP